MIDVNSRTWAYLKKHLADEIEDNRRQLESVMCPIDTANILRGRILAARAMLELSEAES